MISVYSIVKWRVFLWLIFDLLFFHKNCLSQDTDNWHYSKRDLETGSKTAQFVRNYWTHSGEYHTISTPKFFPKLFDLWLRCTLWLDTYLHSESDFQVFDRRLYVLPPPHRITVVYTFCEISKSTKLYWVHVHRRFFRWIWTRHNFPYIVRLFCDLG